MKNPKLTVVMPIFNGEKYLSEAINSVLNQTFVDFEFIIINDGSTDESLKIIQNYKDDRIVIINNNSNRGIYYCRNLGLEKARGKYLAWIDCDDVSMRERFEEQVNFLEKNFAFGACGTLIMRFGGERYTSKEYQDPEIIKAKQFFKPAVANASVMLRLDKVREYNLKYDETLPIAADFEFIFRCSLLFPITNLKKVLYKYRDSDTSITKKYASLEDRRFEVRKTIYTHILKNLKINPSESELYTHISIASGRLFDKFIDYKNCFYWLKILERKNEEVKLYKKEAFKTILADQFYFISKKTSQLGLSVLFYYLKRGRKNFGYVSLYKIFKLSARCLVKYNKF